MDKLTAIKIKYDDGTYSDEIPVSVLSENVEWDNTHTLVDVLGSIDVDAKGSLQNQIDNIGNTIYPVGAIYLSTTDTSPASLFGGTWERLKDRFLLAAGNTYAAGSTGGEATHKLSVNEMPSHSHEERIGDQAGGNQNVGVIKRRKTGGTSSGTVVNAEWQGTGLADIINTNSAGGSAAHNNMPPYLAVYAWKRVA